MKRGLVYKFQSFISEKYGNPKTFCDQHGFSKTFIYSIFNGEKKKRRRSTIASLCQVLGPKFSIKEFLED